MSSWHSLHIFLGFESILISLYLRYKEHILQIEPQLQTGRNIMVAAHANSLRAIIMYIEKLTPQEVMHYFLRIDKGYFLQATYGEIYFLVSRLIIWNYQMGFHYFIYVKMENLERGAVLLDLQRLVFMLILGYELSALCCTWSYGC